MSRKSSCPKCRREKNKWKRNIPFRKFRLRTSNITNRNTCATNKKMKRNANARPHSISKNSYRDKEKSLRKVLTLIKRPSPSKNYLRWPTSDHSYTSTRLHYLIHPSHARMSNRPSISCELRSRRNIARFNNKKRLMPKWLGKCTNQKCPRRNIWNWSTLSSQNRLKWDKRPKYLKIICLRWKTNEVH